MKVRFGHQQLFGWLIRRTDTIETAARLTTIKTVVSALPVLEPKVFELAQQIAQHYGSITADVLRAVVPRRVAGVEREIAEQIADHSIPAPPAIPEVNEAPLTDSGAPNFRWALLDGAEQLFIQKHRGHYALTLPSAHGSWMR